MSTDNLPPSSTKQSTPRPPVSSRHTVAIFRRVLRKSTTWSTEKKGAQ